LTEKQHAPACFEDRARHRPGAARRALRRFRVDLRAADGDHSNVNWSAPTQRTSPITEQFGQEPLVTLAEPADRPEIPDCWG
jgi:hypothetical protein